MNGLAAVTTLHRVIGVLFLLCYFYQAIYLLVPLFVKAKPRRENQQRRYAILIAARNEAEVLPQLLASIAAQDYPAELIDTFVVADNCTDQTAALARRGGAKVLERHNTRKVGKGYALAELLDYFAPICDVYLIFDADNLLAPDFVTQINAAFDEGCDIVTACRNSKNFGDNWVSAGYGTWFLRESVGLNLPRHRLGLSAIVSGTGFGFTHTALVRAGGWHYFSLSEDTEFSVDRMLAGERIGYARHAVFYDEQPTAFAQSWRQRMRWSRGYLTVLARNAPRLVRALFTAPPRIALSVLDLTLSVLPALILNLAAILGDIVILALAELSGQALWPIVGVILSTLPGAYLSFVGLALITTLATWRQIRATPVRKLAYTLTFPLYMLTYLPITVCALLRPVKWEPIKHKALEGLLPRS